MDYIKPCRLTCWLCAMYLHSNGWKTLCSQQQFVKESLMAGDCRLCHQLNKCECYQIVSHLLAYCIQPYTYAHGHGHDYNLVHLFSVACPIETKVKRNSSEIFLRFFPEMFLANGHSAYTLYVVEIIFFHLSLL